MNLAGVEGENGAQAGVFLPYSRHALPCYYYSRLNSSFLLLLSSNLGRRLLPSLGSKENNNNYKLESVHLPSLGLGS